MIWERYGRSIFEKRMLGTAQRKSEKKRTSIYQVHRRELRPWTVPFLENCGVVKYPFLGNCVWSKCAPLENCGVREIIFLTGRGVAPSLLMCATSLILICARQEYLSKLRAEHTALFIHADTLTSSMPNTHRHTAQRACCKHWDNTKPSK